MKVKVCTKCRQKKPYTDFHKQPGKKAKRHEQCKKCRNAYFRRWYENLSPEQKQIRHRRAAATQKIARAVRRSDDARAQAKKILTEEIATAHIEGTPTARLTSAYMRISKKA